MSPIVSQIQIDLVFRPVDDRACVALRRCNLVCRTFKRTISDSEIWLIAVYFVILKGDVCDHVAVLVDELQLAWITFLSVALHIAGIVSRRVDKISELEARVDFILHHYCKSAAVEPLSEEIL